MTVCVAAIASNGMIFAASDRMLSTTDIAYEPENRKICNFTTAIVALWSGDASVQAEVLSAAQRDVDAIIAQTPPPDWFYVKEVVDLYVAHWNAVKRKRAEAALLAPLGLNMESFLDRQRSMDAGLVERLSTSLVGYMLPHTSCIIAGIDHTGPHLWTIHDGAVACLDQQAFAAIGAGVWHANSQMMQGKHSRTRTASETLVLTHLAKKRAEVSPSVGEATDILMLGPQLGQHGLLKPDYLLKLDDDYEALAVAERAALAAAVTGFDEYLQEVEAAPAAPQEADDEEEVWTDAGPTEAPPEALDHSIGGSP